jgi:RNA polymerase sigma-70 factor (ECF subfamily)
VWSVTVPCSLAEGDRVSSAENSPKLLVEERALIHDAQRGDRPAFAALVERYWDHLFRWLYHLSRDRHAAEDLTQETFLKALAHLQKFRAGTNFRAWLFRIAHNAFINQARAGRQRQPLPEDVPALEDGPAELAQQREAQQLLSREVGRLPAEFRAAFLLRVEEGLSFRQIADILGLTEETARWRVFKARRQLLRALAPELEREPS